jgi:hypothetical protein
LQFGAGLFGAKEARTGIPPVLIKLFFRSADGYLRFCMNLAAQTGANSYMRSISFSRGFSRASFGNGTNSCPEKE